MYIYVSKDMRIRGNFSKPKGPVTKKRLENTGPDCSLAGEVAS